MRLPPVSVIRYHLKELVETGDQQEYGRTVAEYLDQALAEMEELKRLYVAVAEELQHTRTALVDMQEAMARQAAASPRVASAERYPSDDQVVLDLGPSRFEEATGVDPSDAQVVLDILARQAPGAAHAG